MLIIRNSKKIPDEVKEYFRALPTLEDVIVWANYNKIKMFMDIKQTDSAITILIKLIF